jgi:hypothetical protein
MPPRDEPLNASTDCDQKDRLVLAAAIRTGGEVLVTFNIQLVQAA